MSEGFLIDTPMVRNLRRQIIVLHEKLRAMDLLHQGLAEQFDQLAAKLREISPETEGDAK